MRKHAIFLIVGLIFCSFFIVGCTDMPEQKITETAIEHTADVADTQTEIATADFALTKIMTQDDKEYPAENYTFSEAKLTFKVSYGTFGLGDTILTLWYGEHRSQQLTLKITDTAAPDYTAPVIATNAPYSTAAGKLTLPGATKNNQYQAFTFAYSLKKGTDESKSGTVNGANVEFAGVNAAGTYTYTIKVLRGADEKASKEYTIKVLSEPESSKTVDVTMDNSAVQLAMGDYTVTGVKNGDADVDFTFDEGELTINEEFGSFGLGTTTLTIEFSDHEDVEFSLTVTDTAAPDYTAPVIAANTSYGAPSGALTLPGAAKNNQYQVYSFAYSIKKGTDASKAGVASGANAVFSGITTSGTYTYTIKVMRGLEEKASIDYTIMVLGEPETTKTVDVTTDNSTVQIAMGDYTLTAVKDGGDDIAHTFSNKELTIDVSFGTFGVGIKTLVLKFSDHADVELNITVTDTAAPDYTAPTIQVDNEYLYSAGTVSLDIATKNNAYQDYTFVYTLTKGTDAPIVGSVNDTKVNFTGVAAGIYTYKIAAMRDTVEVAHTDFRIIVGAIEKPVASNTLSLVDTDGDGRTSHHGENTGGMIPSNDAWYVNTWGWGRFNVTGVDLTGCIGVSFKYYAREAGTVVLGPLNGNTPHDGFYSKSVEAQTLHSGFFYCNGVGGNLSAFITDTVEFWLYDVKLIKYPAQYTTTFNLNGGNYESDTSNVLVNWQEGGSFELLTAPSKAGATFDGWYSNIGHKVTNPAVILGSATLTARWRTTVDLSTLTLAFSGGDRSNVYNSGALEINTSGWAKCIFTNIDFANTLSITVLLQGSDDGEFYLGATHNNVDIGEGLRNINPAGWEETTVTLSAASGHLMIFVNSMTGPDYMLYIKSITILS